MSTCPPGFDRLICHHLRGNSLEHFVDAWRFLPQIRSHVWAFAYLVCWHQFHEFSQNFLLKLPTSSFIFVPNTVSLTCHVGIHLRYISFSFSNSNPNLLICILPWSPGTTLWPYHWPIGPTKVFIRIKSLDLPFKMQGCSYNKPSKTRRWLRSGVCVFFHVFFVWSCRWFLFGWLVEDGCCCWMKIVMFFWCGRSLWDMECSLWCIYLSASQFFLIWMVRN